MTFKFGVFVLLLVLENSFAAERQPMLSDVESTSYGRQLKHSRISSFLMPLSKSQTDRRDVQRRLSISFRRSLASTEGTCAWDKWDDEGCSVSIPSKKNLLEKSKTEYSKMLIERLSCLERTNDTDCRSGGSCYWNEWAWLCEYMDMRRNHENSPCAKVAPLYFDFPEARTQCPKQDSIEGCNSKTNCRWDSYYRFCIRDEYFIFYGISNFRNKLDQVADSIYDRLEAEYVVPQLADNFTWQSILDSKPISFECPSGIEQVVCDHTVLWTAIAMVVEDYCPKKYGSVASKCNADALCVFEEHSTECESSFLSASIPEQMSALRVLVPTMPEGTDKRIREADFTCATILEAKDCKGKCIWNPNANFCKVRKDYIASILTEPGKNTTDALCTHLKIDGFSYCNTLYDERECETSELCFMNVLGECFPREEFYFSAATEEDPKLKRRYKKFKKQCLSRTTKEACEVVPSKID